MNERKAIVALLTVIAVLLALNLVVKGSRSADAQVSADGEPYVVKYFTTGPFVYLRVWSDGQVDEWVRDSEHNCDWAFSSVVVLPVDHPSPVVDASYAGATMVIEFADGRFDHVFFDNGFRCTLTGEGSDPFCIGDTDRSGVTDFQDIVNVLNDWGECNE